jgi:asparagine synthase (glutamine-hydrolysing)
MCGIFGIVRTRSHHIGDEDFAICKKASSLIMKRGPDDEGFWHNEHVAFSFRRLSIIDLSPLGHQPMVSADGKHTLIFNGELYNYQEIRRELEAKGLSFKSRSDTEVVLCSLIEWGEKALEKFNGMFALAFWSELNQSVLIARDHVGMKPLYYAITSDFFVFGSQLNQVMLSFEKRNLSIDKLGLGLFLSTGHYPSPRTVYNEIHQLDPGNWIKVDINGEKKSGQHFNLFNFYLENKELKLSESDLSDQLVESVRRHLISDVPVATFLSGGIDSGIITGIASNEVLEKLTAYTLSNPGTSYDETERATQIAKFLKVNHKIVAPSNFVSAIDDFYDAYQEPFGDYSAIPAMLVTSEARKNFKVMLSGDGSDEFFFGYNRMSSMLQAAPYYQFPFFIRRIYKRLKPKTPAITFASFNEMVFGRQSVFDSQLTREIGISNHELANEFMIPHGKLDISLDMKIKFNTINRYFQQQLTKLDRASMFNSIEARVPFADKELMKLTISYSASDCVQDEFKTRKVPLQNIYYKMYPFMSRHIGRKMGFTIDMETYLEKNLRERLMDTLATGSIFDSLVDFNGLRNRIESGEKINTFTKWFAFSLQTWANRYT